MNTTPTIFINGHRIANNFSGYEKMIDYAAYRATILFGCVDCGNGLYIPLTVFILDLIHTDFDITPFKTSLKLVEKERELVDYFMKATCRECRTTPSTPISP